MSAEAADCGVSVGLTTRAAEVCCPEALLIEANLARYREEFEILLQVLERSGPQVEPHGGCAAYVDLGDLARGRGDVIAHCQRVGRAVRRELGRALQPALGWDSSKFTAQTAARRTRPGHLLAVDGPRERSFLHPLPVTLLPLPADTLWRLSFLGLRTLGQYAALPSPAVMVQFGRAGRMAHRCARGEDDRPVIPRRQVVRRTVDCELEAPLAERERLLAALRVGVSPALAELREGLKACGQVRLMVDFDDGSAQERARTLLFPTADEAQVLRILEQLLERIHWQTPAVALRVALEQIQDAVIEQLTFFGALQKPLRRGMQVGLERGAAKDEREQKVQDVQRYLSARFGISHLRRALLALPDAPLPEWRFDWLEEEER
jgi:hypothetical protein